MLSDEERIWKAHGEDRVVYDGWLKIYRRTYVLPNGRVAEWDMHAGGSSAAVLALTPDGRLVMVRQFRPGPDRVVLTLPGGLIDPGETPQQAGARELREETGYTHASIELVVSAIGSSSPNHRHVLVARGCTPGHELELDDFEDCEPVVMDVAEVRRELKSGRMTGSEQVYFALDHADLL